MIDLRSLQPYDWEAISSSTRRTGRLLKHLEIASGGRLVSLFEHNESRRAPELVRRMLEEGAEVALVSDAGTPGVSDPGFVLVRAAVEAGVEVAVLPGPCALIAALVGSGLPTDRFLFAGFPPRKKGKRRKWMEEFAGERGTLVFYESPVRLGRTLLELADALAGCEAGPIAIIDMGSGHGLSLYAGGSYLV